MIRCVDAAVVGLIGVVAGGAISGCSALGITQIQSRRESDQWKRSEGVRQTESEFAAIAEYLAAAAAWQTQLARHWSALQGGLPSDAAATDLAAREFFRGRFCAYIVVTDAAIETSLDMLLDELQELFTLAITPADGDEWHDRWTAVDRCIDSTAAMAKTLRRSRLDVFDEPRSDRHALTVGPSAASA